MIRRAGGLRRAALAAAAVVPVLAPVLAAGSAGATADPIAAVAAPVASRAGDGVTVRIVDVAPTAPAATTTSTPLDVTVSLTNTTDAPLAKVDLGAVRGEPIGTQAALNRSLAGKDGADGLTLRPTTRTTVDLPVAATVTAVFHTTTSTLDDGGLCLCDDVVYPVVVSARSSSGGVLGSATTYVPSALRPLDRVRVGWAWPLIDRPHRLAGDTTFLDDDLASSVAGGRLDRALQVVERLRPDVPLTLVIDPELLDELEVMAGGSYTVTVDGRPTRGTGAAAARAWLDRLGTVLDTRTAVQISLTPYADPDVLSLTRSGLTWSTVLPAAVSRRVDAALHDRAAATDVAWPASGALTPQALDAVASSGVTTAILSSSSVTATAGDGPPPAVARLTTSAGPVTGALTSPAMQRLAAAAVADDGTTGALPSLLAEVAVRALDKDGTPAAAVLTPPRYVDPDPDRAVRTIEATSAGPFATPVPLRDLVLVRPSTASAPRRAAAAAPLPRAVLDAVHEIRDDTRPLTSLLMPGTAADALLAGIPGAEQRLSSSAWRTDDAYPGGDESGSAQGAQLATDYSGRLHSTLVDGVRIVKPASGSYTLGSTNSKLPITVENRLPYAVRIDVDVEAKGNLPGYVSEGVDPRPVPPNSKQTVQVPSTLERSGRIVLEAHLRTPDGTRLGTQELTVRSTVFGAIGLVITVSAGIVLALALLARAVRGLRRLRRTRERQRVDAARRAATGPFVTTGGAAG